MYKEIGGRYSGNAYNTSRYIYHAIERKQGTRYTTYVNGAYVAEENRESEGTPFAGGTIIFLSAVSADQQTKSKILEVIKSEITAHNNMLLIPEDGHEEKVKHHAGWAQVTSISGIYSPSVETFFDRSSMAVDLVGLDHDHLVKIASDLQNLFSEGAILIKDYTEEKLYLFVSE